MVGQPAAVPAFLAGLRPRGEGEEDDEGDDQEEVKHRRLQHFSGGGDVGRSWRRIGLYGQGAGYFGSLSGGGREGLLLRDRFMPPAKYDRYRRSANGLEEF